LNASSDSRISAGTSPYYDPYDFEIDRDPHPVWKRLREEMPVYYNEPYNFYALTRYEDNRSCLNDWRTYSSTSGTVLEMLDSPPEVIKEFGLGMLFEEPPLHTEHRSILARSFTPKRIAELDDGIRQLSRGLLDEILANGPTFDFVRDYANYIPMTVISELLGVPESDRPYVQSIADDYAKFEEGDEPVYDGDAPARMSAYFADLIDGVRPGRGEGLISDLIEAEIDDEGTTRRLTTQELLEYVSLVAAAGNETTANLIGWAGVLLARHPDQRRLLVDDPTLVRNAVDEVLRYEAPSPIQARLVTTDVEWHGVSIPNGSKMLLLVGSANRDDRRFDSGDTFDVRRKNSGDHLSLGQGIHFCLGAALARAEARIGLEELLLRVPSWDVDHGGTQMIKNSSRRGWATLPVTAT
jgi:cytochrome P450